MKIKKGVLHLDPSLDNEQVNEILPMLNEKMDEINEVVIDNQSVLATSALFALLVSLKNSKEDIKITIFEQNTNFVSLGNITFI